MYQRPHYYQGGRRQPGAMNYVMPFLIIICIGIIGILLFNLWRTFFPVQKVQAAYLHVLQGSTQMKPWGTDAFFNLTGDSLIMEGDQVRSSADARLLVEFFNGAVMRVDGNTDLSFDAIDDDASKIELTLYDGNVWFNLLNKGAGDSDVMVKMDSVTALSNQASVFELENNEDQAVRVLGVFENEGLNVDVMSEDGDSVVESENVGVGQQIIFTDEVLKRYFAYQSPTVLAAVDDEFKQTDWYLWNIKEDENPTKFEKTVGPGGTSFIKVEPQVVEKKEEGTVGGLDSKETSEKKAEDKSTNKTTDKKSADSSSNAGTAGTLTKPTLTSVAGGAKQDDQGRYQVTSRVTTLTGTISGVDKVVVNGYTLQKFKPGDTTWTYFANADARLIKAGDNTYEVYGLDAKGNKTESLIFKVFYTPQLLPGESAAGGTVSGAVDTAVDGAVDAAVTGTNPESTTENTEGSAEPGVVED